MTTSPSKMAWWIGTLVVLSFGICGLAIPEVCDIYVDPLGDGVEEGSVRLVDGPNSYSGRVEIYHYGAWGPFEDDTSRNHFTNQAGQVICRQLGLKFAAIHKGGFYRAGSFPKGDQGRFSCIGTEEHITECPDYFLTWTHEKIDKDDFDIDDTIGLECLPSDPREGYVQLLYGIGGAGRVITYVNDEWNFICAAQNTWEQAEADVIGKQLGLTKPMKPLRGVYSDRYGNEAFVDSTLLVDCTGQETSLVDCNINIGVNVTMCGQENLAGVEEWSTDPNEIQARLVYGAGPYEGKLELFYDNRWGGVCIDNDADPTQVSSFLSVLCGQLGFDRFGKHSSYNSKNYDDGGIFHISADLSCSPNCSGNELNVGACNGYAWGTEYCWGLIVSCRVTTDQGIQLNGGRETGPIGNPHIHVNNTWGQVCRDSLTLNEATVFCRQAGLSTEYPVAFPFDYYGWNDIFKDIDTATFIVNCTTDTASTINECNVDPGTCSDGLASIGCFTEKPPLRLMGGGTPYSGFLQMKHEDIWTWVTFSDHHKKEHVDVLCQELGFTESRHTFMKDAEAYLFENLLPRLDLYPKFLVIDTCKGDEMTKVADCEIRSYSGRNSINYETSITGVNCDRGPVDQYEVSLYTGLMVDSGMIEVYALDDWGTVCSDGWNENAARVVCRQLGLNTNVVRAYNIAPSYYSESSNKLSFLDSYLDIFPANSNFSWLMGLDCTGSEGNIGECSNQGWGNETQCTTVNMAGVICSNEEPVYELANGDGSSGILLVTVNGITGTVGQEETTVAEYDDEQDNMANIVCRNLGFSTGLAHGYSWMHFDEAPLYEYFELFDRVNCNKSQNANDILECWHEPLMQSYYNWQHEYDVTIECFKDEIEGNIQLIGGTEQSGRISIFLDGAWGMICGDRWTEAEAKVVCGQLGLPTTYVKAIRNSNYYYRNNNIQFAIYSTQCTGAENRLTECEIEPFNSNKHMCGRGAGVQCFTNKPEYRLTKGPPFKLENGSSISLEGLVEVKVEGKDWTPVCGPNFKEHEAELLCKQLILDSELDEVKRYCYGISKHAFKVTCPYDALSIDDCTEEFGLRYCEEQSYVKCMEPLPNMLERLGLTVFDVSEQPISLYREIGEMFEQIQPFKPPFSKGMVLTKIAIDLNQTLENFEVTVEGTGMICYALSTVKKSMIRTVYGDPTARKDMFNGKFKNCVPTGTQDPTTPATVCTYECTCDPGCDHYQLDISNKFQFPGSMFTINKVNSSIIVAP